MIKFTEFKNQTDANLGQNNRLSGETIEDIMLLYGNEAMCDFAEFFRWWLLILLLIISDFTVILYRM